MSACAPDGIQVQPEGTGAGRAESQKDRGWGKRYLSAENANADRKWRRILTHAARLSIGVAFERQHSKGWPPGQVFPAFFGLGDRRDRCCRLLRFPGPY